MAYFNYTSPLGAAMLMNRLFTESIVSGEKQSFIKNTLKAVSYTHLTIIILFLWYWIKEKVCLYGMWKERNIMISFPLIRQ